MGYCTVRSARPDLRVASRVRLQEGGGRRRHAVAHARGGVRRVHETCVNLVTSRDLIKVTLILGAGAKLLRLREYVAARL